MGPSPTRSKAVRQQKKKAVIDVDLPYSQQRHLRIIFPFEPYITMKVLTLNFVNCAAKACKSSSDSFPLHPKDAELVQDDIELNPDMLINVLPRLDWPALRTTSSEVKQFSFFFNIPSGVSVFIFGVKSWRGEK